MNDHFLNRTRRPRFRKHAPFVTAWPTMQASRAAMATRSQQWKKGGVLDRVPKEVLRLMGRRATECVRSTG